MKFLFFRIFLLESLLHIAQSAFPVNLPKSKQQDTKKQNISSKYKLSPDQLKKLNNIQKRRHNELLTAQLNWKEVTKPQNSEQKPPKFNKVISVQKELKLNNMPKISS